MKRICAVVAIALFTSATALAQSAEQDIRKLLNEFRAAGKAGDKAVFARILADDLLWVNDQGGLNTKADRIAGLKGSLEVIQREVDIKVYGDSASAVELLEFPEGLRRRLLWMFVRQNKEWKAVRVAAVRLPSSAK
jgi:ketosteroid isomerase-like protein